MAASASSPDEATRLLTEYSTYNGKADSPATLTESAEGCFKDDGDVVDGGEGGEDDTPRTHKGLSVTLACAFLLAQMAGAGLLSLPKAVSNTGWVGLPMLVLLGLAVGYSGTRLAYCWLILEERWPEYRAPCRRPYPEIGRRALGLPGRILAEVSMGLTLFGTSTVYLLLAAQMARAILQHALPFLSQCAWSLILGVLLCPITWLGTPKDFWGAPLLALTAMVIACLVVMVEVVVQRDTFEPPEFHAPTFRKFFLGFGANLFALSGASIFPTIQNDMKDRSQFPHTVIITFLLLLVIYLPVSAIPYGLMGSNVPDNIMMAVSGPAVTVMQTFILFHFLFVFPAAINPVNQALEGIFRIPNAFGVRRIVMRTTVVLLVVLTGFAIPDFGKILDLVGGSTVAIMSFVLPPIAYLRLMAAKDSDGKRHGVVPNWEVAVLVMIVVLGVMGGVASTYSALVEIIAGQSFNTSCFSAKTFIP